MRYKLLLVTDHFPPEQSGGVGRSFSLYKYLPEFDFDVFILTKNSYGSLNSEHNVFRSDSYTNWKKGKFLSIKTISKILLTPFYRYVFVYSDIWWRFKALKAAEKLVSDYSFDLIYASFPSVDNFKIGLQLNEKYDIPLICEFRDGLVFESIIYPANFIQKRITEILEKRVLKKAKAIITICTPLTEYFKNKWNIKNILTVNNGYDLDDFTYLEDKTDKDSRNNKIKIAHFGNLNASRATNRENLFIALKKLKVSLIINSSNFELSIFGKLTVDEHKLIDSYELDDIIIVYPFLEKITGFQIILDNYDYLLLYGVAGHTSVVSSKLPEYLKLGKPILGICRGNEAEIIINQTRTGEVSDFDSLSIESLFRRAISGNIKYYPDSAEISKYDRRYQADILAQYLKSLIVEK